MASCGHASRTDDLLGRLRFLFFTFLKFVLFS